MQFTNIDALVAHISNDLNSYLSKGNSELQIEISFLMKDAVEEVVYDAYTPSLYERRGDNGGLSDPENLELVKIEKVSHKVSKLVFENITRGNPAYFSGDKLLDSTAETIVNGIESNWSYSGEWQEPRDFVSRLREMINERKDLINNAIKKDLKNLGYKVR